MSSDSATATATATATGNATATATATAPTASGLPPFRAIPDVIAQHASQAPRRLAVQQGKLSLNWGELGTAIERVAATLQRDGVQPRESIAICGANSIDYLVLFLGALRAGVVVAPLPTGALPEQLAGMVEDSGARLFFTDGAVPEFDTAPRLRMDDSAALLAWLAPAGSRPAPWRSSRTGRSTSSIPPALPAPPRASCSRTRCAGPTWRAPRPTATGPSR